jgi:hypothetical protein
MATTYEVGTGEYARTFDTREAADDWKKKIGTPGGRFAIGLRGGPSAYGGRKTGESGQSSEIDERLGQVEEAGDELRTAQEEDIAGQEEVNQLNKDRARALATGMEAGQQAALEKFDTADAAAETGLREVRGSIEETREQINKMPEKVQGEFDRQQTRLDSGLEAARSGIAGRETSALASVVQGQGAAMDAAVAGIHGAMRQQTAAIDAQVQQGTLSPSQAQSMKTQLRMGGAMQLSTTVGQTIHMFKQTEAQVATAFGSMFTQFESTAQQVQGQFGAAAGGAFAQATAAASQFNTQLTQLDGQITANRDARLSQNAGARAAAQNANDTIQMSMLDYTADQYVQRTPAAINNYTVANDLYSNWMRNDQFQQSIEMMREANRVSSTQSALGFWGSLLGLG